MLRERAGEPIVSSFTAVNGSSSPSSPPRLTHSNGMPADAIHMRPYSQPHPDQAQDQKAPLPGREQWSSASRAPQNGHYSASPPLDQRGDSPQSPPNRKRERSSSEEHGSAFHSPNGAPEQSRRRLDSYASASTSPGSNHPVTMEHPHQRTLPPMNHSEQDRNWHSRDTQEPSSNTHYRDSQGNMHSNSVPPSSGSVDADQSSTIEITRAGVQLDAKKRKRVSSHPCLLSRARPDYLQQFANRTKTGCQTCRRRKKKCDEAKPECKHLCLFRCSMLIICSRQQLYAWWLHLRRLRSQGPMAEEWHGETSASSASKGQVHTGACPNVS